MPVGTKNFPTSLDTVVELVEVTNDASTQLNGALTIGATTITVDSTSLFPSSGIITIDSENISYAGKTATTFTGCTRAAESTTAATHDDNATVELLITAALPNVHAQAIIAIETKLGIDSSTPTANKVLRATGTGTSAWGAIVNADIDASAAIAVSKFAALTASRLPVLDASGFLSASSVTATEAGYLSGVTSAIQTQLDGKQTAFGSQTANFVYAGPASGGAASPAFRALVAADIPSHNQAWSTITSTPTTLSGYGITDAQPLDSDLTAIAALSPSNDDIIQRKTGAWTNRTMTQLTADLNAVVGDSGSGGTKGLVPAPAAGDAAAGKFLKADGTWAAAGGGLTVGSTAIGSGTTTRVLYNNGGTLGEYPVTGSTNVVMSASPTIVTPAITTTATVTRDSLGTTSTDGIILTNTTAAAAGAQQYSPRLRLTGQGWKTNATAASQDVNWIHEVQPVQAAANPTSLYVISSSVNGGAYTRQFAFTSASANRLYGDNSTPYLELSSSNGSTLAYGSTLFFAGGSANVQVSGVAYQQWGTNSANLGPSTVLSWAASGSAANSADTYLRRNGAANIGLGATTAAASPVAQTLSTESVVAGTTNTSGATWTLRGSLGTSQGVPGRIHLTGGALIAASGSTQQTAVDRAVYGATKVLTNNSAIAIVNATAATETNAAGVIDYAVEVLDGTDVQYEVGSVAYGVSNKGGVFSGNTATKFGNHQNATSGTLTVTFAISGANPAVLSVNANSSLSPSTGYPRITYTLRNLTQQAVAVQ